MKSRIRSEIVAYILSERSKEEWKANDGWVFKDDKNVAVVYVEDINTEYKSEFPNVCFIVKDKGLFSVKDATKLCSAGHGKLFLGWKDYNQYIIKYMMGDTQCIPEEITDEFRNQYNILQTLGKMKKIFA